jgi:hypothetical protein
MRGCRATCVGWDEGKSCVTYIYTYSYTVGAGRGTLLCAAFAHNSWNRVSVRRTPGPE